MLLVEPAELRLNGSDVTLDKIIPEIRIGVLEIDKGKLSNVRGSMVAPTPVIAGIVNNKGSKLLDGTIKLRLSLDMTEAILESLGMEIKLDTDEIGAELVAPIE